MAVDGSEVAVALLGLRGFRVLATHVDVETHVLVETDRDVVGCAGCGTRAVAKGRATVSVRDLPAAGRPVVLVWRKRRWRCPELLCPRGSWTETHPLIPSRSVLTARARREMCRRVGEDGHTVAEVARSFGVSWATAMTVVRDVGRPLVDDPARTADVTALGLDETAFLRAGPDRRTRFVTGFCDLRRPRLLDVVDGRSATVVDDWLVRREQGWLDTIDVVALDPHRGYANGLIRSLGHATTVVDHFHSIRLANQSIDDVRRRTQNATLGHRGRKGDPLYGIRRQLLVARHRLTERGWQRILDGLRRGDPYDEVAAAYWAKELLRDVYAAPNRPEAHRRLVVFYQWCADIDVPELVRLARTISTWENQVLAYHDTGLSNGPTEAMNLLIEKIRRLGHGFRNLNNYRLRLLLTCGGINWHTPPVERLRSRKPRFVA